jgi:hypothetical protein
MQDRYNFVLDKVWECILPGYKSVFEGIANWLGEKNRVNPPGINYNEIEDVLANYPALFLSSFNGFKTIRANIGPNVFHVTSYDCLENIAKQGLKLTLGDKGFPHKLTSNEAVFLCKSPSYGACICGRAQNLDNQVVIEIERDKLNLHKMNSMGHDWGLVENEGDLEYQLGSYEPIKSSSIVKVYLNKNKFKDVPEFYKDKFVLVDVILPNQLEFKAKNTWTRLIAESKS